MLCSIRPIVGIVQQAHQQMFAADHHISQLLRFFVRPGEDLLGTGIGFDVGGLDLRARRALSIWASTSLAKRLNGNIFLF